MSRRSLPAKPGGARSAASSPDSPAFPAVSARGVPLQEGFMADGPGFHVWEETHGEALASAGSLADSVSRRQAAELHRGRGRKAPEAAGRD